MNPIQAFKKILENFESRLDSKFDSKFSELEMKVSDLQQSVVENRRAIKSDIIMKPVVKPEVAPVQTPPPQTAPQSQTTTQSNGSGKKVRSIFGAEEALKAQGFQKLGPGDTADVARVIFDPYSGLPYLWHRPADGGKAIRVHPVTKKELTDDYRQTTRDKYLEAYHSQV